MKKKKLLSRSGDKTVPAFTWISRKARKILKKAGKIQGRKYAAQLRHVLQGYADDLSSPSGKLDT